MTAFLLTLIQYIGATALLLGVLALVSVVAALVVCLSARLWAGAIIYITAKYGGSEF